MQDRADSFHLDISMPVLDGFAATRAIRELEAARRAAGDSCPPALIIALTGLASSRDQSEAFTSGVDLYMTKPVSFREVGKVLDGWEAHAARENCHSKTDGGDEEVVKIS